MAQRPASPRIRATSFLSFDHCARRIRVANSGRMSPFSEIDRNLRTFTGALQLRHSTRTAKARAAAAISSGARGRPTARFRRPRLPSPGTPAPRLRSPRNSRSAGRRRWRAIAMESSFDTTPPTALPDETSTDPPLLPDCTGAVIWIKRRSSPGPASALTLPAIACAPEASAPRSGVEQA